jgi:AbiU2
MMKGEDSQSHHACDDNAGGCIYRGRSESASESPLVGGQRFFKMLYRRYSELDCGTVAMTKQVAEAKPVDRGEPDDFTKEVNDFSTHCAYIRSVYVLATRIWRDSSEGQRKLMESIAPSFVDDIGQVLAEYVVLAACRVTDPAKDGKNENLTLETFVNSFGAGSQTGKQLDELRQQMVAHRKAIEPARHKLIAHADREVIRQGKPLGLASWRQWDEFWAALRKFVMILNESILGTPYDIEIAGVPGDAEMVLKSLQQSKYFETILREGDQTVKAACLKIAAGKV